MKIFITPLLLMLVVGYCLFIHPPHLSTLLITFFSQDSVTNPPITNMEGALKCIFSQCHVLNCAGKLSWSATTPICVQS